MLRDIFIIGFILVISAFDGVFANDIDSISYDYPLMKSQISLMAKNIDDRTIKKNVVFSDSIISFKNKDGYVFKIKILSYEYGIYKTHKFIAEVFPPNNRTISNFDVSSFFDTTSFEVLRFSNYMFFDEIKRLCELMKEKMAKPFELLKRNEIIEDYYYDSCFVLLKKADFYSLVLEGCDKDVPYESLSFMCFENGRNVFEYSLTLP